MAELMAYLPENYLASRETAVFQGALQPEIDGIWAARDDLLAQLNPYTATWGLDCWENALGLLNGQGMDPDARRRTVAAKLQGRGPTTAETIRDVAETFLGVPVTVTEVFSEYRVALTVEGRLLPLDAGAARLREQLISILPAHLDFQVVIPMGLALPMAPRPGPRCSKTEPPRFHGGGPLRADICATPLLGVKISSLTPPAQAEGG